MQRVQYGDYAMDAISAAAAGCIKSIDPETPVRAVAGLALLIVPDRPPSIPSRNTEMGDTGVRTRYGWGKSRCTASLTKKSSTFDGYC